MREECPNCGAELRPGARVCPECGPDEKTGWSEAANSDGLDLPGESFDYDEFTKREFGGNHPVPAGVHPFWWVIAVLLLAAIALFWFGR